MRAHTGRKRNEAARRAVLTAAIRLLASEGAAVSIDAIAAEAGVGKQTIYRWWPSKGAVLLEAMTARAGEAAPEVDTGSLRGDLLAFLKATFHAARSPANAAALRAVLAESLRDDETATLLRRFTESRRAALGLILERGKERGDLPDDADLMFAVDQAYGLLWYRLALTHGPLTATTATQLTDALLRQLATG